MRLSIRCGGESKKKKKPHRSLASVMAEGPVQPQSANEHGPNSERRF